MNEEYITSATFLRQRENVQMGSAYKFRIWKENLTSRKDFLLKFTKFFCDLNVNYIHMIENKSFWYDFEHNSNAKSVSASYYNFDTDSSHILISLQETNLSSSSNSSDFLISPLILICSAFRLLNSDADDIPNSPLILSLASTLTLGAANSKL